MLAQLGERENLTSQRQLYHSGLCFAEARYEKSLLEVNSLLHKFLSHENRDSVDGVGFLLHMEKAFGIIFIFKRNESLLLLGFGGLQSVMHGGGG